MIERLQSNDAYFPALARLESSDMEERRVRLHSLRWNDHDSFFEKIGSDKTPAFAYVNRTTNTQA